MAKPLWIVIAVHKAATMPVLDGVLKSAEAVANWAAGQGYEVVTIDDRTNRATTARIKNELTPLDPSTGEPNPGRLLDRPRIVAYFCGHGLHAPQDQYWILSAGPNQPNERVSAVGFRDMLATYGPKQIAFISDACRSAQVVQGLASSVVDRYDGQTGIVQKDNFFSSQDGHASFAIPSSAGGPAYCVFSSVLVRALSAPVEVEALDQQYLQLGNMIVSSQSLATYLETKVPDAALGVGKLQVPQCDPGFRPTTNDYVTFGAVTSPFSAAEAVARQAADAGARAKAQSDRIVTSRSEWRRPYVESLQSLMGETLQKVAATGRGGLVLVSSRSEKPQVVQAAGSPEIRPAGSLLREWNSMTRIEKPFANSGRSGVIVITTADLFAAIPFHDRLWCLAVIEEWESHDAAAGGVELLAWGDVYPSPHSPTLSAAETLKGLSSRTLNAEDARLLATDMRYLKHADPMYGIVAAYLYNGIGDVSNIRRMCSYYQWRGQDVPFDIALLAGTELKQRPDGGFYVDVPEVPESPQPYADAPSFVWEKTPAVTVDVAGVTPLVRAGWQHVEASRHAVHRKCWELTPHLTNSPISSFRGREVGARLIDILRTL